MQHAPLANAACCIFHPTARQYCGEASSPSKPSASCCFLIPSEKSCQCFCVMRASAFCCAGLCVLLHGSFVFSCASLCPLLRGSKLSLVRVSAFFCVNQWRGRCGLSQWKWRGDGTVELGAAGRGFPVGGFGEIDRCFEKRSAAGWIDPTAALACAERQGFEPWIQSPVCRISSAVHSTTLASLLFGECCSACAMRPRVVVEAVEQSLSKRKVTATFSFQQTLERKSVPWAGCFYFRGRWFVLFEQRLSVIQTGVLGFPSGALFLFCQRS